MRAFSRWRHRNETPAKVVDGVAYYPNRRTKRALREVERYERGEIDLDDYEPLVSKSKRYDKKDYLYKIKETSEFRRNVKQMRKRGADLSLLDRAIDILGNGGILPPSYLDHPLDGELSGRRECHIKPDWLFEYSIDNQELTLIAFRTGTHADLYGK